MFGFNVNFGGMGEQFETFDCMIDIEENGNKQRQRMQAPRIMIQQQFMSLVQQAAQANHPVRVRLSRMSQVYDEFGAPAYEDEKPLEREFYIDFSNNAWGNHEE